MILFEYIFFGVLGILFIVGFGYFVGFITKMIVSAIYEVKYYYENKYGKEEKK